MKIGISALLFNIEEGLEICKNNKKIEHIEIGLDNLSDVDKLKKYKKQIEDLNLSVSIHLPMELNSCEDIWYIREKWAEFIFEMHEKLKDNFKVEYYNFHLGYVIGKRLQKNRQKYLNNTVEFLNFMYSKYNFEKSFLTMENTYSVNNESDFANVGNSVSDFEHIFKSTENKNVFFCYDTGHDLINRSDYRRISDKIKVIHLSDNDGIVDSHVGYKSGILNEEISDILDYIYKINPNYLILEIDYSDLDYTLSRF